MEVGFGEAAADVDVDLVSSVAQDYVKAIWSATEWGGPAITGKALATRFGTTTANVTETIKRLAGQGLVDHQPYKPIQLTSAGTRLAVAMVRRHRLIETFLVAVLGYHWDEVHDEAERLEHAATEVFITRIDALLGHPTTDPHGDPIPTATGELPPTDPDMVPLSDAGPGRYVIRRVSDADPAHLATATELDLTPGTVVEVDASTAYAEEAGAHDVGPDDVTVDTPAGRRAVPSAVAAVTWATPADNR